MFLLEDSRITQSGDSQSKQFDFISSAKFASCGIGERFYIKLNGYERLVPRFNFIPIVNIVTHMLF